jgi:hypothetical protein
MNQVVKRIPMPVKYVLDILRSCAIIGLGSQAGGERWL